MFPILKVAYYMYSFTPYFLLLTKYPGNHSISVCRERLHSFSDCMYSHVWLYHRLFNMSSIEWHLSWFQCFLTINNTIISNLITSSSYWWKCTSGKSQRELWLAQKVNAQFCSICKVLLHRDRPCCSLTGNMRACFPAASLKVWIVNL